MNRPAVILLLTSAALNASCSHQATLATDEDSPSISDTGVGTTLLVSLDDGSIIKQVIDVGADICFKQVSASTTTCFTQGEAIHDPVTNDVIAHEMIEDRIDLIAKSN